MHLSGRNLQDNIIVKHGCLKGSVIFVIQKDWFFVLCFLPDYFCWNKPSKTQINICCLKITKRVFKSFCVVIKANMIIATSWKLSRKLTQARKLSEKPTKANKAFILNISEWNRCGELLHRDQILVSGTSYLIYS